MCGGGGIGLPDPLGLFGGGGGGGSAPAAPDYRGAAEQTAKGNLDMAREATKANRVNQITPYGSLTWNLDPGYVNGPFGTRIPDSSKDTWTQTITLSPEQQRLLDQQNRTSFGLAGLQDSAIGRVSEQQARGWNDSALTGMEGPLDRSALPGMGSAYDATADTNRAQELINARLLPQQERDRAALETRLANQGITQGSEAWRNAIDDLGRTQNDARQQAALSAINLGMSQQGQRFNQMNQNRGLATNEIAQRYSQALQNRQQGLQEQNYYNTRDLNRLNAIRTGSQVTNPQFGSVPMQQTTAGPDYLGATNALYANQMNAYNAGQARNQNMMGGLLGLAGTLGSAWLMS